MPTKIRIVETPNFQVPATTLPLALRSDISELKMAIETATIQDFVYALVPFEYRSDPEFAKILNSTGKNFGVVSFARPEDLTAQADRLAFLWKDTRTYGVKTSLAAGTTIYSETFFNANGVGAKIDPCYQFIREKVSPQNALQALGALQALLFLGLQQLPNQGEQGSGERVDVQIGSDDKSSAFTVRFDLEQSKIASLRLNPLLELPRSIAHLTEIRYLEKGAKLEILCWFAKDSAPTQPIEAHSVLSVIPLENKDDVKNYVFKDFQSLTTKGPATKDGFKKKFSDRLKAATAPEATAPPSETIPKIMVSGNATLSVEKAPSNLEKKIADFDSAVKQQGEKNPKATVTAAEADKTSEQILHLEGEVLEAQKREKELLAVLDKAVKMKDEAVKKIKEFEIKLSQAQGGNNSKIVTLEKQLEEQKKQNKALMKKMEAGNKAA